MNNAFEILMFLVFFAPLGLMVALNLVMYREAGDLALPPAPVASAEIAAEPAHAEASNDYELQQAA
jgi:hypothetical protein